VAQAAPRGRWRFLPQIVVAALVLGLLAAMAVEPTRRLLEQRERIEGMARDLGRIKAANRSLEDRIVRLRDPDYIEQRAREQVGLIRPGETAYVVMPPSGRPGRGRERARARPAPSRDAPPPGVVEGFLGFLGFD
jgi:cell division protein FtsB